MTMHVYTSWQWLARWLIQPALPVALAAMTELTPIGAAPHQPVIRAIASRSLADSSVAAFPGTYKLYRCAGSCSDAIKLGLQPAFILDVEPDSIPSHFLRSDSVTAFLYRRSWPMPTVNACYFAVGLSDTASSDDDASLAWWKPLGRDSVIIFLTVTVDASYAVRLGYDHGQWSGRGQGAGVSTETDAVTGVVRHLFATPFRAEVVGDSSASSDRIIALKVGPPSIGRCFAAAARMKRYQQRHPLGL